MVLFLLSSRTNFRTKLDCKTFDTVTFIYRYKGLLILNRLLLRCDLLLLHIITCETHQYCNNRFLGYKGLLNRVQSNLNITINLMDFKIAIVNYEEFIPKKKKNTKFALNFTNKNTKNPIYQWLANCVYIYRHTYTTTEFTISINLAITLSPSNASTLF